MKDERPERHLQRAMPKELALDLDVVRGKQADGAHTKLLRYTAFGMNT